MNRTSRLILAIALLIIAIIVWETRTVMQRKGTTGRITRQMPVAAADTAVHIVHPRMTKIYDSTKIEYLHPFIIYHDGSFMVASEIESRALFAEYQPIFDQYGLSGNGYCWEGIITQILLQQKPTLLNHIDFDPEAGGFYAYADSPQSQREFATFLSDIFKDHAQLHKYLKTIDKSLIFN